MVHMWADEEKKMGEKQSPSSTSHSTNEKEELEDLIIRNKTLDALIKGLSGDIELFKDYNSDMVSPANIVRFNMQLNIMKDKKMRNLSAINEIIKRNKEKETASH